MAEGGGDFFEPQVLDDFVSSGRRLVLLATGGGRQRLVLASGGGLGWCKAAVRDGLLLASDGG